jgi:hypothetical protein
MAVGTFTGETVVYKSGVWEPNLTDSLFDLWYEMGSSIGNVWDETKSTVSGAVDTVVQAPAKAWESVKESAKEAVTEVTSGVGEAFSWLSVKALYIIGGLILVFGLLAKTGVIPQVADLMRAFYGG